ncbi:gluconokinase [Janibacter alkaliphilus]|uniref:Gluconokinase n=1 Tax=Janibacter alkaliphilus TaxID=1069963 RepID=A0A852X985_9MICO|nr:gluconokinase [Janibacter alkaliphilus]NYG38060.1 gluconokinase [Janibacter alkaliphilus]
MSQRSSRQIVVMGVSGTGKTVLGRALAEALECDFVEGDAHHPPANIAKMSAGHPLDDDDRRPWLEELGSNLGRYRANGVGVVLACSSLKRSYRDILRGDGPMDATCFVHIDLPFEVLEARMKARDHFMPASLLQSQFDTLEALQDDECAIIVNDDDPVAELVDGVVVRLAD